MLGWASTLMSAGYRWEGPDLILQVQARPRAGRDQWDGLVAEHFRIRIAAPPVDGQANAHLREFLATLFGVAKSQVSLLSGETGRTKRWRIVAPQRFPFGIDPPSPSGPAPKIRPA